MTDTAARLLQLLPLLTARPSWRGEELAERMGVTTRTIRRDIDRLRDLGYPVHAVPGPQGGYALGPGAGLPPLLLDDDSAVAVVLGLRVAAADPSLRYNAEAAVRAAAAIDHVMPPRLRRRVEALTATTVPLRSRPPRPPDAARFVSEGITTRPYRWQARVRLDAPAGVVAGLVPSTVAVVEAVDEQHCVLTSGSDSLDAIALHLAELGIGFTPLEPPELRERCLVLAGRLAEAARQSTEEPRP